jgi:hypothetical protein
MYTADRQLTDQGKERKQQLLDCARPFSAMPTALGGSTYPLTP